MPKMKLEVSVSVESARRAEQGARVNVALPASLHRRLKIQAAIHGVTIQDLLEEVLENHLKTLP